MQSEAEGRDLGEVCGDRGIGVQAVIDDVIQMLDQHIGVDTAHGLARAGRGVRRSD